MAMAYGQELGYGWVWTHTLKAITTPSLPPIPTINKPVNTLPVYSPKTLPLVCIIYGNSGLVSNRFDVHNFPSNSHAK